MSPERRRISTTAQTRALPAWTLWVMVTVLLAGCGGSGSAAQTPRYRGLTTVFNGGIAAFGKMIVPDRRIVAFGWSPDGRRVAYLTNSGSPQALEFDGPASWGPRGRCTVQTFDVSTKKTVTLASWQPGAYRCTPLENVAWSPDGRYIAFERNRHVTVVDSNGNSRRVVGIATEPGLTWWPGGKVAYRCRLGLWCTAGLDGSRGPHVPRRNLSLVWSPESGRIAYLRDPGFHLQVWTARPNGSDARMVFAPREQCCLVFTPTLAWSPDGTKLIVIADDGHVIDVRSGRAQTLYWLSGGQFLPTPSWQPSPAIAP